MSHIKPLIRHKHDVCSQLSLHTLEGVYPTSHGDKGNMGRGCHDDRIPSTVAVIIWDTCGRAERLRAVQCVCVCVFH